MTDEFRPSSSRPSEESPEEAWEDTPFETDVESGVDAEPTPMYGRPAERRLGREIPLWAIGAAILVVIAVLALLVSMVGGGEPEGTPTPNAATVAFQQTMEAMKTRAATPTPVPPTPTPTPTPEPKLVVGRKAVVTGSEPEGLLLRGGPGRESPALVILKDGTILELLPKPANVAQYPVEADGYTWWRVRVLSGVEKGLAGWVAADWLEPMSEEATPASSSQ